MRKFKFVLCIISSLYFLLFLSSVSYANSAEPPALIVAIRRAPKDVNVSILNKTGDFQNGIRKDHNREVYFAFYYNSDIDYNTIVLQVSGNDKKFEVEVDNSYLEGYENTITLDFKTGDITSGRIFSRDYLMIAVRISLTLLIEGIVFFLFGFKSKRSWRIFLVTNLITQGILNFIISSFSYNPFSSYIAGFAFLLLLFLEFLIVIIEIIVFTLLIKEHKKWRSFVYAFLANLISFILGAYIITLLPF